MDIGGDVGGLNVGVGGSEFASEMKEIKIAIEKSIFCVVQNFSENFFWVFLI